MRIFIVLACFSLFTLQGCGSSKSNKTLPTPESAQVEPAPIPLSDVEIVWQAPLVEVEGFVVYYGYSKSDLGNEVRVATKDLSSFNDPDFGKVFRHVLRGLVSDQTIYVAIASLKDGELSQRSSTMVIEPTAKPPADSVEPKEE